MSVAASRYAKALLDVLFPSKAELGREQLHRFLGILSAQPDARTLLENPTLSAERRRELVNRIAETLGLDKSIRNFLALLVDRNRLDLLEEVLSIYEDLLDGRLGVVKARVTTALELDPRQESEIAARLQAITGKKIRMEVSVDPSLIGGLLAQVGGTIYDGSIRQQLETFRNNLIED
jgi:F-type H+-transporting ATPase subunit delta